MDDNHYNAPKGEITDSKNNQGSPVKAVLFATCFDILFTFISSLIVTIIFSVFALNQGVTPEELQDYLLQMGPTSLLAIVSSGCGLLVSFWAGYFCARIGRSTDYKLTTIYLLVVCLVAPLVFQQGEQPLTTTIFQIGLTVASGYGGCWFYLQKRYSHSATSQ